MRRLTFCASLLAATAGCVHSQDVPPVQLPAPTPTVAAAAGPVTASPAALTLSVSGAQPPNPSFATLTIAQQGASQPPFVIQAQSTCLTKNNLTIFALSTSGSTSTYQVRALNTGQCVMVFGATSGATVGVPVTILP